MNDVYFWIPVCFVMTPLMLLAGWMDWRHRRIPNLLNIGMVLSGLVLHIYFEGWAGIVTGINGLMVGTALLIVPWLMHMMGPGDVKFLGAIGFWLGPRMTVESFVLGGLIGGIIGVVMILMARRVKPALENISLMAMKCSSPGLVFCEIGTINRTDPRTQLMPYGVPLTIGTLIVTVLHFTGCW